MIHNEGQILFANQAIADMLGFKVHELLALTPEQVVGLVHPDDREEVAERIALRLAGRQVPQCVQFRILRRDGSTVQVEALIHAIPYEGRPALFTTSVDITRLRRTNEVLRAVSRGVASSTGDDSLRTLTRHLAEGMGVSRVLVGELASGGKVVRTVAAVADGREVPPFEYALTGEGVTDPDHPDSCVVAPGACPVFPGEGPCAESGTGCCAAAILEDQTGAPVGILVVVDRKPLADRDLARTLLDIIAPRAAAELIKKKEEATLRQALGWRDAIVEGAPDAIFISDASARFVIVNAAACELTGYTRRELLGMRIPALHAPEDLGAYRRLPAGS